MREGHRLCSSGARECVDVERKRAECRGSPCVGSGGRCSLRFSTRPRICNDFSGRAGPGRWLIGSPCRAARRVRQLALWPRERRPGVAGGGRARGIAAAIPGARRGSQQLRSEALRYALGSATPPDAAPVVIPNELGWGRSDGSRRLERGLDRVRCLASLCALSDRLQLAHDPLRRRRRRPAIVDGAGGRFLRLPLGAGGCGLCVRARSRLARGHFALDGGAGRSPIDLPRHRRRAGRRGITCFRCGSRLSAASEAARADAVNPASRRSYRCAVQGSSGSLHGNLSSVMDSLGRNTPASIRTGAASR